MFTLGQINRRSVLSDLYGEQRQSGCSNPVEHDFIFLFKGGQAQNMGY